MMSASVSSTRIILLLIAATVPMQLAQAQNPARPIPYPVTPPPEFREAIERGTRTMSGEPGPQYWQQWAQYALSARLDPSARRLDGQAQITYFNRSPDTLETVALQLLQNLHSQGAVRNVPVEVTGGIELKQLAVDGVSVPRRARLQEFGYLLNGTAMLVQLQSPLAPGDSSQVTIEWGFRIPQSGASGRMGRSRDDVFHLAYWYPQLAVYEDVGGWQLDQFRGGAEFFSGFGNYEVTIEAPEGWVLMGTGLLLNPEDVLPQPVLDRYRRAHRSDDVVHVLSVDDVGPGKATRRSDTGVLTWRFRADSVRDVAFSAVRHSRWDAARTSVGDRNGDGVTDYALINTFWRSAAPKWSEAWRYAQHAIAFLSEWTGYPYPWPHMTAVEGGGIIGGGMEYPMMTLIGDYNQRSDSALYFVTAHELGHMWLPMIVSSDERRHAWMDEGTTTFNENQARKDFFPGVDHDEPDRASYIAAARSEREGEIIRWSDFHRPGQYGMASYAKPATVLAALRGVLGEDTFRRAFRQYIRTWAFKHPKPWDLFNTFNTVSGRDLNWFWRSWYYETWSLDQAIGGVQIDSAGTTILIEDRGWVPMPARVEIFLASGDTVTREIPVDHWLAGNVRADLRLPDVTNVIRVVIDPAGAFPDIARQNNSWTRGGEPDS